MNTSNSNDDRFIARLKKIVEANLADEKFGVNELVLKMGLSRSHIHRRLKSIQNKSVSRFIKDIRLKKAKELLEDESLTSSEIAYRVGFGSPAYFIKCFHDYFGYPPGEYLKYAPKDLDNENAVYSDNVGSEKPEGVRTRKYLKWIFPVFVLISAIVIIYLIVQNRNIKITQNSGEKSIVVLSFLNFSSADNNDHLADVLTIVIRNQLTKIHKLKIISGPTTDQIRENALSSPEIALQVNAKYILSGSVQQQDNDIHINIELTDALKDQIIWSEKYDRKNTDIYALYIDIAKNVADNLQTILSLEEIEQIDKSRPINPEAYYNFLMGQHLILNREHDLIYKGIEYFKKAIEIDSNYTQSYAGLADAYYVLSILGIEGSTGYDMAYKMAEKALEKDSTLSEAYAVLGAVSCRGYWEWEKARSYLEKAIEIDSNCYEAHLYYSSFLDIVGEPDKAIKHVNKAIELQPFIGMHYVMKGIYYRNEKKYHESIAVYKKLADLNPERWQTYNMIFLNYIDLKDEASALETLLKILSLFGFQKYENKVYPVYETSGFNGVLKFFLEVILKENKIACPADIYAILGMKKEALDCLERRCRNNLGAAGIIRRPEYESLYSEPRFQALVDTMNLRPYFPKPSK